MTTRKRIIRSRKNGKAQLSKWNLEFLFTGRELIKPTVDHDDLSRLWKENREWILPWWTQTENEPLPNGLQSLIKLSDHHEVGPCTRPWAWWQYDALKENRRIVSGKYPKHVTFSFGRPTGWGGGGQDNPIIETQFAYLLRHNLLFDHEKNLDMPMTEKACELK